MKKEEAADRALSQTRVTDCAGRGFCGKLIASEKIGNRSFAIWSKLLKKAGAPNSLGRNVVMTVYIIFLLILIVTVVPLNMLIRKLIYPWRKESIDKAVAYFEQPSGK
ncbi:MAG: hypothetical protein R3302_04255 [Sulfurimonadaceae bacterium]|nr:hypothetical protein [Sulfurimonadaceae bacterium]